MNLFSAFSDISSILGGVFYRIFEIHSHLNIVLPLQLNSQCYCLFLFRGFYNTAIDGTHKCQGKLSKDTKDIRLYHLRVLLTSLNIFLSLSVPSIAVL